MTESFEIALIKEVKRLREIFAERDVGHIRFVIECDGPTMRDEIRIKFIIDSDYNTRSVEGNMINETVEEFFRRNKWQKHHNYLALPNVSREED
jgi:hypothetical protein